MTGRDLIKELLEGVTTVNNNVGHLHEHILEIENKTVSIEELLTRVLTRLEHRISGDARFGVKFGSPRNKTK